MILVQGNEPVRNVAKDALSEVTLLGDSVFFGINGSGKSTISEVLSGASTLKWKEAKNESPLQVVAFDDRWRKERVGEFIEGGTAEGVTTVKLNEDAKELETQIRRPGRLQKRI